MPSSQEQLFRLGDAEYGRDWLADVILGLYSNATGLFKFGRNSATGIGETDIWDEGGLYSYATVAETLTISSDDAVDTAAGTGARTVFVMGLDANFLDQCETVTLNGTAGVTLVNQYIRIYRCRVMSAGTGGRNAGSVYVGKGAIVAGKPATVYAKISETMNQTLMSHYTVPADKRALIIQQYVAHAKAAREGTIFLFTRRWDEVFQVKNAMGIFQQMFAYKYALPPALGPKTDIVMRANMLIDTEVSAGYDLVLFDNDENMAGGNELCVI